MDPAPTIDAMRTAAGVLRVGDVREKLHSVQAAQDALDAAKAMLLAELEASKDFEIDGASTLNAWVRTQLRMNAGQATALVRSVAALRDLSLVAEAAVTGQISAAHVRVFVYGLAHVGLDLMRMHEELFVQVACEHEPGELFEAVKHLKDRTHPDDLDDAWEKGMDKQDFQVNALPDGWHVTGFLNTVTGAMLKKVLDSVSAPDGPEDPRSGSERRVQGLDDLLSSILGSGQLPSDKGLKPHVSVFADADTVAAAAEQVRQQTEEPYLRPDPMPPTEPATLAGHGAIGPNLLMYFMCISEVTAFLMGTDGGQRQAQVLNAGTAKYQPNLKQRRSVIARQGGVCATPGCNHTHLEIHHVVWWSLGGRTDVDQLIGLCVRCHHLLHRGRLHIEGNAVDGFTFTNRAGRPIRRRRRTGYRQAA
ncbi:HNH endonuclease [Aeromicrobium wangtongii]|uniref:HNH endonuclease n=1 Tax=Aeromicrobium wangtongii TaxID=2969247 RepID=A0ABY5M605_9ACTN|nr:HNH endonuclease signature motif containing protein [Aeromicrobium wangtongii]MCD9198560.1 HNH endonuclease [Aeromicrobium wangtongii]UUP12586.1 HNH endonuclease [Aeromicrobium wangtongii]